MNGFKPIYEGEENGIDNCIHLECETCGAKVERGIENVANHYVTCAGKELYEIIKTQLEKEIKFKDNFKTHMNNRVSDPTYGVKLNNPNESN